MKKFLLLFISLGLVLLVQQPAAAEQVRLKFIGSIYTDAEGVALRYPAGVTISGESLLIADSGGKRVLTYRVAGGQVTPDKSIAMPKLFPLQALPAENGDLYVLDGRDRQIVVFSNTGQQKGKLQIKGLENDRQLVPRSIKLSSAGELLILDIFSQRVLVVSSNGQLQRQIALPAKYAAASDITSDSQGNLYLLDGIAGVVYRAAPDKDRFSAWSNELKDYTNFPTGIAAGPQGRIFLTDKHGSGLAILAVDGSFAGRRLSMGWNEGQLYYPNQLSISTEGQIFIADTENHRVQQFNIEE